MHLLFQSSRNAFWIKDKELATAFGLTLALSRLASILNFLLTVNFAERFDLSWMLWSDKWPLDKQDVSSNIPSQCKLSITLI